MNGDKWASPGTQEDELLEVDNLTVSFETVGGTVAAVNGLTYRLRAGETLGMVGESGSGKSVGALAMLGLLPKSAQVRGRVMLCGKQLVGAPERHLQQIRGRDVGFVFQDPVIAFNPLMRIGAQVAEAIRWHHRGMPRKERAARAVSLLGEVGIPNPRARSRQYPHEFSGGMLQRAMIAMAIANRPRLIIADEPTTALDMTLQAQILDLLRQLQQESGAALIMITHDFGVIAEVAQRVAVMYGGRIVESADVDTIFHQPRHPYTHGLLQSRPRLDTPVEALTAIGGHPPDPRRQHEGCAFLPRCHLARGRTECTVRPEPLPVAEDHQVACHFQSEMAASDDPEVRT